MKTPETHLEYAQRIGIPRVVACDIDVSSGNPSHGVWVCRTHEYEFNERPAGLARYTPGWSDRCPMSRLEEWRARRWAEAVLNV